MNAPLRLMLAVAVAFSVAGTATPVAAQRGQTLAQGERPRENKMTREAQKQLERALEAGSPEAGAPFYQVALDSANSAIRENAKNPLGHRLAAEALIGLNRLQEAAAALEQAETLRPIYALETEGIRERAWIDTYQRAQPFLTSGEYMKAAEVLEGANSIYKMRPEIMIVLGQIYAQENQPDKAITHLKAADDLITTRTPEVDSVMAAQWKDQQAEIPVTIAQAYISAKRFDEASAALAELVAANPDNTMYARNLANIYAQSEKPDSASAVYMRLLQRSDVTPSDLYQIGIGLYTIDKFTEAADAFKKGTMGSPKDRDAFEMWARTLQLANNRAGTEPTPEQLAELTKAAEGWVALDPSSRVGYLILAQTVNKAKNEARVAELVQKMEAITVGVSDLQLRRNPDGGASLSGTLENYKANQGTVATLTFTFFDKSGATLGTQSVQSMTGAPSAEAPGKSTFNVTFNSDKQVDGYSYTVSGL
jgi:tetratricopeptide (TPR) repeat protein